MAISKVPPVLDEVNQVVNKAADFLSSLTAELAANQNSPKDVNNNSVGNIIDQASGALSDVHRAAQLRNFIPLALIAVGVLIGRVWLGVILAALVWYAGQQQTAPADAARNQYTDLNKGTP
jgi:hypothetical protein